MTYVDILAELGPAVEAQHMSPDESVQKLQQVAEVTDTGALDMLNRWEELVAYGRQTIGPCSVCHRRHTGACRRAG